LEFIANKFQIIYDYLIPGYAFFPGSSFSRRVVVMDLEQKEGDIPGLSFEKNP